MHTLMDRVQIHYAAEPYLLLIRCIQPKDEVLQHVGIRSVGVVETQRVNEVNGAAITLETENLDISSACSCQPEFV